MISTRGRTTSWFMKPRLFMKNMSSPTYQHFLPHEPHGKLFIILGYQQSPKNARVENILTGVSESSKILYSCPEFLILPDMKWDLKTISSLYLVAITQDRTIRSLRDLRKHHVGLLKSIRL